MKRMLLAGLAAARCVTGRCSGLRRAAPFTRCARRRAPGACRPCRAGYQCPRCGGPVLLGSGGRPFRHVPHENLEGGIWVLFNKPVVALKTLAEARHLLSVLTISPRVDGIYRWYGSRLLSFEPKGQLAPATEYTFSVSKSLQSLDGER